MAGLGLGLSMTRQKLGILGICKENLIVANTGLGRWVGGDYVGSYTTLTTPPCMYKESWRIKLNTFTLTTIPGSALISERSTSNSNIYCALLVDSTNPSKIKVFFRNALGVEVVSATHTTAIKPFTVNKPVIFERIGGTIYCTQGAITEAIKTGLVGEIEDGSNYDSRLIGATWTGSGIISDYSGDLWDIEICDVKIPINEGTGTDIHDSNGNVVGTLTDPTGKYWKSRIDAINIDGPHMSIDSLLAFSSGAQAAYSEGSDFGDAGNPSWQDDFDPSTVDVSARHRFWVDDLDANSVYQSIGHDTTGTASTYYIVFLTAPQRIDVYIAGQQYILDHTPVAGELITLEWSSKFNDKVLFRINGGEITEKTKAGAAKGANKFFFFKTEFTSAMWNGGSICDEFYSGYDADLNFSNLTALEKFIWNDSRTTGSNGTVVTWTDGTPTTLWDYWFDLVLNKKITAPKITVNPEDNADILAQTGLTSADESTQEEYIALDNHLTTGTVFIEDNGMHCAIYSVQPAGNCFTRALRWIKKAFSYVLGLDGEFLLNESGEKILDE